MEKIDKSNMRQVILDFPKQFRVGIEAANKIVVSRKLKVVSNIIICGMGGSALPGNILKAANYHLSLTKVPIFIYRSYDLPKEATKQSLIVCISYSGNTEETISAFKEAKRRNLKIMVITSGGKLSRLARKSKVPLVKIPGGVQPRCALGYQFSALAELLSKKRIIKKIDKHLLELEKTLQPKKLENKGKNLAKKLKNSLPLVYSSNSFAVLAKIWKIKFDETAKIPSFFNFFPELNHNEMIGIGEAKMKEIKKFFKIIILQDQKTDKRIIKRVNVMTKIFREKGIGVIFVNLEGKNFFEKLFSNILICDWTSYYLALSQRIDPSPVKLIEEFKRRIGN